VIYKSTLIYFICITKRFFKIFEESVEQFQGDLMAQIRHLKILITLLILLNYLDIYGIKYEEIWGMNKTEFISKNQDCENIDISSLKTDEDSVRNKINLFFNSIKGESHKLEILRKKGNPEKDFCFFNEKLYVVTENWGKQNISKAREITKTLENSYKIVKNEAAGKLTTTTFLKDKTKIILYKKEISSQYFDINIVFYDTEIFNLLLDE